MYVVKHKSSSRQRKNLVGLVSEKRKELVRIEKKGIQVCPILFWFWMTVLCELTTQADDEEDLEEEVTSGVQDASSGQRDDSQTQVLYGLHTASIT